MIRRRRSPARWAPNSVCWSSRWRAPVYMSCTEGAQKPPRSATSHNLLKASRSVARWSGSRRRGRDPEAQGSWIHGVVHKPSLNYKSRATPWPMGGLTALMQVNTANPSVGKPTWVPGAGASLNGSGLALSSASNMPDQSRGRLMTSCGPSLLTNAISALVLWRGRLFRRKKCRHLGQGHRPRVSDLF